MWQEEPGDRAGVIDLHAIELSAYRKRGKEKEKKRAMRCHDWWPTTFCLSSILKLILHAPTAIFFFFPQSTDLARQYMTSNDISELHWVGVWEPCQQHVHTVIRRYEHRTCEHRANIQKYLKLIKNIYKCANAMHLELSRLQICNTHRLQSWAKSNALVG